ncbi:MAG: hypothetical protein ACOC9W_06010, partial [Persicimonas sp.]
NPWIAGVSSLFTVEHFERSSRMLEPGGIYAQWVQLYEIGPDNVRRIFATFLEAFDHVHAYSSMPKGTDLILLGSNEEIPLPIDGYERAFEIDSVREELERVDIHHPEQLHGLMFMGQDEIEKFARGAELNTDDNGLLEFDAPKDVIEYEAGQEFFAERYHKRKVYGDIRPYLQGWPDGDQWSRERVGRLARAQWMAGKLDYAATLLEDAGYGDIEEPSELEHPLDALDEVRLVRHTARANPGKLVVEHWPDRDSKVYALLRRVFDDDEHADVARRLDDDFRREDGTLRAEAALLKAYLQTEAGREKKALKQLEGIDPARHRDLAESLPYLLIEGYCNAQRLEFADAYRAYVEAGRHLASP